jgi:endonuclease/exonuclease/phosphatase family metal-dependent hydrolase
MTSTTLMTFNTQHCANFHTNKIDYETMANAIKECNPDIVGLQEIRGKGVSPDYEAQTEILAELCGMKYCFFAKALDVGGNNPYGNALLSKIPIVSAEIIPIPDPNPRKYNGYYESRCILKARLENGLLVLVTHFGLNPDEQENAVNTVLSHIEKEQCILMGDFNVKPDNPTLVPLRERMTDLATAFDAPKLSFPSDNPTIKIDYIFVSPDIQLIEADIPELIASDHRPHVAEIKFL